jgi:glucosamine-phosphate N-acetyltransferase
MSKYIIRPLQLEDYHKNFLQLLEQLTTVDAINITYSDFVKHFNKMNSNIFVVEDNGKIIGTCVVLVENKFIHKLGSVGHIEDVVVDEKYRSNGLGKQLINFCTEFAKCKGCYKVILDCDVKNKEFYERCGFECKNVQMSIYV